tara:strand:+ start:1909 stop:2361 length:453 start_codon:yes stop_codon:yes gene_type:complete
MKKIILILLTFLTFTNCGYSPIYSSKNFDFNIIKIDKLKKDRLNLTFEKRLNNLSDKQSMRQISLKINAKKQIITVSKDVRGDPSRYQMIIKLSLDIINDKNLKIQNNIQQQFSYNTNSNKFALSQYEKEIEEILINKIIEEVVKYLSKV